MVLFCVFLVALSLERRLSFSIATIARSVLRLFLRELVAHHNKDRAELWWYMNMLSAGQKGRERAT